MKESLNLSELCQQLNLSVIAEQAETVAEMYGEQAQSFVEYLTKLLQMQFEARLENRLKRYLKSAHFPILKTLASFDFETAPSINKKKIKLLANNGYIEKAQSILLMGEPGTGKTHLAIALGYEAINAGYKVRFITVAQLATQLMEAKDAQILSRIIKRFTDINVLILDELGYFPLTQAHAELIFQILSARQEQRPVIVTTNLPFSEWSSVFPEPRLCKAATDRLTHQAHIIDTGTESIRLAQTLSHQEE